MSLITLKELTDLISNAIGFEVQAAISAAKSAKQKQDMENFLMAQSYVMGLQKAVELINSVLKFSDKNLLVKTKD